MTIEEGANQLVNTILVQEATKVFNQTKGEYPMGKLVKTILSVTGKDDNQKN